MRLLTRQESKSARHKEEAELLARLKAIRGAIRVQEKRLAELKVIEQDRIREIETAIQAHLERLNKIQYN